MAVRQVHRAHVGAASAAPRSLAALKRTLKLGDELAMTHYGDYGPGDTIRWGERSITLPRTRAIARVQTNAIAFHDDQVDNPYVAPADRHLSWLWWPKAADVTFHDDGSFTVGGARVGMTYRVLP